MTEPTTQEEYLKQLNELHLYDGGHAGALPKREGTIPRVELGMFCYRHMKALEEENKKLMDNDYELINRNRDQDERIKELTTEQKHFIDGEHVSLEYHEMKIKELEVGNDIDMVMISALRRELTTKDKRIEELEEEGKDKTIIMGKQIVDNLLLQEQLTTKDKRIEELKPCPFCGEIPEQNVWVVTHPKNGCVLSDLSCNWPRWNTRQPVKENQDG